MKGVRFRIISTKGCPRIYTFITGGFSDLNGMVFAMPAVVEKGYMDIRMDVLTPGGHSSKPPKHTVRIYVSSMFFIPRHEPIGNRYPGRPYHRAGGSSTPTRADSGKNILPESGMPGKARYRVPRVTEKTLAAVANQR